MSKAVTMRTGKLGKKELRLVEKDGIYHGLVDGKVTVQGDDADDVWRQLHDEAGKSNARYFGFDGARARFLRLFPGGFGSDAYVEAERGYKLAAKAQLDETVPLDAAASGSGFGEAVLRVFQRLNILSQFELIRVRDVLRSSRADTFVQAAACFTLAPDANSLAGVTQALTPDDAAKWTVATYLPYLWRPEAHMFLKPEATKDFAVRVGHRFADDYTAELRWPVYESLLDLAEKTAAEIADLNPADRIDIQSFVWVVGRYEDL